ncbi:MAG: efflux RND transporter periplasmic adaptor subunit [Desulfobacterales bacterium]|nr:efflux RND transporter periplasmic adaptor subunit [Desulfobacterales bacterium]
MSANKTFKIHACLLTLLILLSAVTAGCTREDANASAPAPPPPGVTVSRPLQKYLTHFTEYTGTTEALETVSIRARVEGTLTGVHFTPGDAVEKGQLLYTIDPADYQATLDEAKATLAIREAELELAAATLLRREKAYKDRAVSEVAVIQARADLSSAKAGRAAARAAIRRAAIDLSHTRITAPISGKTSLNLVDAGNLVGAGEYTLLTSIVRDDHIYAYFTVNERDLLRFRQAMTSNATPSEPSPAAEDTPVLLGLANQEGHPFEGKIDYIDPQVDTASGTIRVRGIFPNPDHRILPGLYARVKVPTGAPRSELLVPDTAVSRDQKGYYLLVADPYDKVKYQPVETGPLAGHLRVIRQGIKPGDRIIINGLQKARPGSPVSVIEEQLSMTGDETHKSGTATPAA